MLAWFIYITYFEVFTGFVLKDFTFYMATAYLLFGILLLAGGFMQKPTLTVIQDWSFLYCPLCNSSGSFRRTRPGPASVPDSDGSGILLLHQWEPY